MGDGHRGRGGAGGEDGVGNGTLIISIAMSMIRTRIDITGTDARKNARETTRTTNITKIRTKGKIKRIEVEKRRKM